MVEKYTIETDTWQLMSPMSVSRDEFVIVALGKYLYAIGGAVYLGTRRSALLKSVGIP